MEFRSEDGACAEYDLRQERLVVVRGGERHEIQVRAQVHRLVRHMAERNAAAGAPVVCAHDELMRAVWGDEPLHGRTELAKLVWELRRQLEAVGAAQIVENEPRRGYRLRTCPPQPAERVAASTAAPRRRVAIWVAGATLAVALVAAAVLVALVATRSGGGGTTVPASAGDERLGAFVDRIENVLDQSSAGRREIHAAIADGMRCRISPDEAARRISSVADNRQSILQQLGALQAPTPEADRVVTLLQRGLQQSIEADRHYRDGFLETQAGARCPLPSNAGLRMAARSDALATAAKRRFAAAFNPLAARFGRPTWPVGRI